MDKYNIKTKKNAVKNAIISFILGDVLGTPVQFMTKEDLYYVLKDTTIDEYILKSNTDIPFGVWSDDSSMTLCTVKSILEKEKVDLYDIVQKFKKWLEEGYMTPNGRTFDVGTTTRLSLNKYIYDYEDYNNEDEIVPKGLNNISSNGNGSLMRILPVSIYCYFKNFSKKQTFEIIKDVSCLTHAHPISVLGCYIYTLIVFDILDGKSKDEIITNLNSLVKISEIPYEYRVYLKEYYEVISGRIVKQTSDNIGSSGYVKSTLEVTLWGFYNSESVEDCIFKIIKLGEDSDTNGAISGGLSGLYYGLRGNFAQQCWTDKIIKKDMISDLINKYAEIL